MREMLARATPLHGYTMRMFGIPESEIAKSLREIEEDGVDARRGRDHHLPAPRRDRDRRPLPRRGGARPPRRCARGLAERHRRHLFSLDGETIDAQVAKLLAGRRLGLAESCSGGLMAARMTNLPGSSDYFMGGIVAYTYEAKEELLGVDPRLIEEKGAVSPEVAEAMAIGALERFGPTSRSRSPASPGPTAAARRSRSATSASTPASPTAPHRPRPGHPRRPRRHPRTLGAGRDAPAADAARRRRGAASS